MTGGNGRATRVNLATVSFAEPPGDRLQALFNGVATGASAAAILALGEIGVRAALAGGMSARELARALPLVVGATELLGLVAGIASAALAIAVSLREPRHAPRRAFLMTLFFGLAGFGAAAIAGASGGRAFTAGHAVAALGLGVLALILIILADGAARSLRAPRRLARVRSLAAPFVALPILAAFPRLLLGESPGTVDPFWSGLAIFCALLISLLVLVSLVPLPGDLFASPRDPRRRAAPLIMLLAVAACAFLPPWMESRRAAADPRPNLILLVVDTLRPDHLSAYGYGRATSPAVDSLAARGVLFTGAVTPAPFTMPAVASILTSRLPYQHGVRCHPARLPSRELTLAEELRREGYVTGAVVSNPLLSRAWGFDQGFDSFDEVNETTLGELGRFLTLRAYGLHHRLDTAGPTAARAVRWLHRHHHRPFFLYVQFMDPHFPYDPAPPFNRRFTGGPTPEYDRLLADYNANRISRGDLAVGEPIAASTVAQGTALYDGEIASADAGVGRIEATLSGLGLDARTFQIFTADHGEALGEHGVTFAHTFTTYDELVRVPLVALGAGVARRGARCDLQVDLLDVAPTLIAAAGGEAPAPMRGASLLPLLADPPPSAGAFTVRAAYAENAPLLPNHPSYSLIASFKGMHREGMAGKWRMVRLPPWKLIHVPGRPEGENMLFNLADDPGETHDLVPRVGENPEAAAALGRLTAALDAFREEEEAAGASEVPSVSPRTVEELRSLGYVH